MSEKQKNAIKAYDKIKSERGEVTFIDAFIAGYEQAAKDAVEWLEEHINDYIINDKQHPNSADWLKVKSDAFEDLKKYMKE